VSNQLKQRLKSIALAHLEVDKSGGRKHFVRPKTVKNGDEFIDEIL